MRLDDVVGASQTKREAIDSMNLFLASETFEEVMGGKPRRGVLFEGPPGTGKTYLAKAMAAEAGVPFHFVSASEFQSMYYGQTNKKIRTFFKNLRKAAREEGGAIGYIEEFDAIGGARSGMNTGSMREGIVGIVNELLVQMQSFDLPDGRDKFKAKWIDWLNKHLPPHRRLKRPAERSGEHLDRRSDEPRRRPRPCASPPRSLRPHRSASTSRRAPIAWKSRSTTSTARTTPMTSTLRSSPISAPATRRCASRSCSTRR